MNTTTECEMEVRPSLNPDTLDKLAESFRTGAASLGVLTITAFSAA